MRTFLLSIGALLYAATSVSGHAVLIEPPPRTGMGKSNAHPQGRKLQGENAFRNIPENLNNPSSGCGNAGSTGNTGPAAPKVTWKAGDQVKICWETTIAHPEQAGTRSPGIRVSIAYQNGGRFDTDVLIKDVDGGNSGTTYCKTVQLPANKNCPNGCVLQWAWVSIPDGGAYLACADIRILPASNEEGCRASLWLGQANTCAQGHGMYDFSPMEAPNAHPGGQNAIRNICGTGKGKGNWGNLGGGSHNQFTNLITNKQDIVYQGRISRRLGPAVGCPQNAQNPPNLPPAPITPAPTPPKPKPTPSPPNGGGGGGGGQPAPTPPPAPVQPGANCAPNVNPGLIHSDLPYPVRVSQAVQNGQTANIQCTAAHPGYTRSENFHNGFTVRCTNGQLSFVIAGTTRPCAKLPSCSEFENNPDVVCGSLPFSINLRNNICTSGECVAADCCVGGGQLDMCDSTTRVSLSIYNTNNGQCNGAQMFTRADIVADDTCRNFNGGDGTMYYKLACRAGRMIGKWACTDSTCSACATQTFVMSSNDVSSCATKSILCRAGDATSCQLIDVLVQTAVAGRGAGGVVDAGTTMTTSILGVVVGVMMAFI